MPTDPTTLDTLLADRLFKGIDRLNERLDTMVSRAEYDAMVARIESVVPRSEQEQRFQGVNDKLDSLTKSLSDVKTDVADIKKVESSKERWPTWLPNVVLTATVNAIMIYWVNLQLAAHVAVAHKP